MSILAFQMPDKVVMEKSDDFHGLFTFKPLEKGYGVTVGNALRRILLSSLEGYAITGIKVSNLTRVVPFERFSSPRRTFAPAYRTWPSREILTISGCYQPGRRAKGRI